MCLLRAVTGTCCWREAPRRQRRRCVPAAACPTRGQLRACVCLLPASRWEVALWRVITQGTGLLCGWSTAAGTMAGMHGSTPGLRSAVLNGRRLRRRHSPTTLALLELSATPPPTRSHCAPRRSARVGARAVAVVLHACGCRIRLRRRSWVCGGRGGACVLHMAAGCGCERRAVH